VQDDRELRSLGRELLESDARQCVEHAFDRADQREHVGVELPFELREKPPSAPSLSRRSSSACAQSFALSLERPQPLGSSIRSGCCGASPVAIKPPRRTMSRGAYNRSLLQQWVAGEAVAAAAAVPGRWAHLGMLIGGR
jgi:hypothetical protein